jgi:hypothetical protein
MRGLVVSRALSFAGFGVDVACRVPDAHALAIRFLHRSAAGRRTTINNSFRTRPAYASDIPIRRMDCLLRATMKVAPGCLKCRRA